VETLFNTIGNALGAVLRALGYVGRPRLRAAIREDLELLHRLETVPDFERGTPIHGVMLAHIGSQILRLVGIPVVGERKQVQWNSVFLGLVVGGPLAYGTYALSKNGFSWWSLLTGAIAFFFLVGGVWGGLFPGRHTPEDLGIVESATEASHDEASHPTGSAGE
jgi:hypothetical protein